MKIIDFQSELKNRKGEVIDIREHVLQDNLNCENENKNVCLSEDVVFATIDRREFKRISPKDIVSSKDIISQTQKKKVGALFKRFARCILSNKKASLIVIAMFLCFLSAKGMYSFFSVHADSSENIEIETYAASFNKSVEEEYLKKIENLSTVNGEVSVEQQNAPAPVSREVKQYNNYFSVSKVSACFTEDVKGKHSTYSVLISVAIPTDKISINIGNIADITYSAEDINIESIDIKDNFNREYLASMSVSEKTVKDIETLIEEEKESIREMVNSKSKQEFMNVIDKAIQESINL